MFLFFLFRKIKENVKIETQKVKEETGLKPGLAIVQVSRLIYMCTSQHSWLECINECYGLLLISDLTRQPFKGTLQFVIDDHTITITENTIIDQIANRPFSAINDQQKTTIQNVYVKYA